MLFPRCTGETCGRARITLGRCPSRSHPASGTPSATAPSSGSARPRGSGASTLDELDERVEARAHGADPARARRPARRPGAPGGRRPGRRPRRRGGRPPGQRPRRRGPPGPLGRSGTARKSGRWVLPGFIRLSASLGRSSWTAGWRRPSYAVVDVEIVPSAGSVVIVVPAGWAADIDRLGRGIGSAKSLVAEQPTAGIARSCCCGAVWDSARSPSGTSGGTTAVHRHDPR